MKTQLKCAKCTKTFEVSNAIAEAMHRWRAHSGEAFLCEKCAGNLDEIISIETDTREVTSIQCPVTS